MKRSKLNEFFAHLLETTPFASSATASSGHPASMSGSTLSDSDIRLARQIIQASTADLQSSGIQVGSLLSALSSGQIETQTWLDLQQALKLWRADNPGNGGTAAQVDALLQKISGMIGRIQ